MKTQRKRGQREIMIAFDEELEGAVNKIQYQNDNKGEEEGDQKDYGLRVYQKI